MNGRRVIAATSLALLFFALLVRPTGAFAFTFSDGIEATCTSSDGGVVRENYHPADDPSAPGGFIGFTHFDPGAGWITDWNVLMLSSAPSYVHDFVFFHECAHAKSRSFDEVKANCLGLLDMRAAGRAGTLIEARLAAYHKKMGDMGPEYGQGKDFWARTVACANHSGATAVGVRRPSSGAFDASAFGTGLLQ